MNHARATVVRYSELRQVVVELSKQRRTEPATAARLAESLHASLRAAS